jgi:hypothetical protein
MRRLHLATGLIALTAFLASGLFMRLGPHHLSSLDNATRLLFRSTHIYLLFTALLNLVLGMYAEPRQSGWRAWVQRVGSALVLVAPALLGMAFLREPWLTNLARPYTQPAVIGSFVGVLCHLVSSSRSGPRSSPDRSPAASGGEP